MTTPVNDFPMPYEVQLYHDQELSSHQMAIVAEQRTQNSFGTHYLKKGVYLMSLSYNGAPEARLRHHSSSAVFLSAVSVPAGTAGTSRTSAPMKISVLEDNERITVSSDPITGGDARATISVIPFETYKPA